MGTKRRVESESNAEPLDSTLRSKRVVAGPSFDLQRARSSQQHVRALNTQFASGVGAVSAAAQAPSTGSKSLAPVVTETAEDVNDDDETEQPSSPSLKRTEEHGIVVVHEVKCKLYVKAGGDTSGSESGTAVARTYLLRTKTEEEINKLAESIREHSPSS
ncbi:hypothetical protein EJ110_NYTH18803 [Nymphaea thermarum]|nr:hypothetical protein EJ110_NYTH18803 [Nymphaea thermarum]